MADEIREYVRAAQAAELRGQKRQAIELLRRAAALYREIGRNARALVMLRHARRLDVDQPELDEEIRRLESMPDGETADPGEEELSLEVQMREILAPLGLGSSLHQSIEDEEEAPPRELADRGPALADANLAAWCSFCCRPSTEVGMLVGGPTGAFVCSGCVDESRRLLSSTAGRKSIKTTRKKKPRAKTPRRRKR